MSALRNIFAHFLGSGYRQAVSTLIRFGFSTTRIAVAKGLAQHSLSIILGANGLAQLVMATKKCYESILFGGPVYLDGTEGCTLAPTDRPDHIDSYYEEMPR